MSAIRVLVTMLLLLVVVGCKTTSVNVYPVSDLAESIAQPKGLIRQLEKDKATGFYYSLPRTLVDINIEIEATYKTPGEYSEYCRDKDNKICDEYASVLNELGIDINSELIINKKESTFAIKSANICTSSEPDPDQQYFVEIKNNSYTARELKMTLNELGVISDTTSRATDKRIDYAVTGLSTVMNIIATVSSGGIVRSEPIPSQFGIRELYNEMMTIPLEESTPSSSAQQPPPPPDPNMLVRIRKDKEMLSSLNTAYYNFSTRQGEWSQGIEPALYEAVNKEYKTRIESLLKKFVGSKVKTTETVTARIRPENGETNYPLFTLTDHGLIDFNDCVTRKVFEPSKKKKDAGGDQGTVKQKSTEVKVELTNLYYKDDNENDLKKVANLLHAGTGPAPYGLAYRVPGKAKIRVMNGDDEVFSGELVIAQLGTIAFLPREFEGKESGLNVTYYPESGALKVISVDTKPPEPSDIKALGESATGLLGEGVKALKGEEEDEATKLQREADIEAAKAEIVKSQLEAKKARDELEALGE